MLKKLVIYSMFLRDKLLLISVIEAYKKRHNGARIPFLNL